MLRPVSSPDAFVTAVLAAGEVRAREAARRNAEERTDAERVAAWRARNAQPFAPDRSA